MRLSGRQIQPEAILDIRPLGLQPPLFYNIPQIPLCDRCSGRSSAGSPRMVVGKQAVPMVGEVRHKPAQVKGTQEGP